MHKSLDLSPSLSPSLLKEEEDCQRTILLQEKEKEEEEEAFMLLSFGFSFSLLVCSLDFERERETWPAVFVLSKCTLLKL